MPTTSASSLFSAVIAQVAGVPPNYSPTLLRRWVLKVALENPEAYNVYQKQMILICYMVVHEKN